MTTYYVIVDERSGSQECNERVYKYIRELRNRVAELEAEHGELKSKLVTATAQLDYHKAKGAGIPKVDELVIPREVVERYREARKGPMSLLYRAEQTLCRAAIKALEGEG